MTDLYNELLNSLESDKAPEVKAKVTSELVGDRRMKLEFRGGSFKSSYTSEEVQLLFGFAISLLTSMLASTSITRLATMANTDALAKRVQKYLEECKAVDHTYPEDAPTLLQHFADAMKQAADAAGNQQLKEKGIDALREPVDVRALIATAVTCFMAGRNPEFFMPGGDTKDARVQLILMAVTMAYRQSKVLQMPEIEKAIAEVIDGLLDDSVVDKIENGRITPEQFADLVRPENNGQEE